MTLDNFKWVQWSLEKKPLSFMPWKDTFITLDDLEIKRPEACRNKWSILRSVWQYTTPLRSEYKIGDLIFDFDCSDAPEKAQADCFGCVTKLCETYGLSQDSIEIFFSGSKGFGARIPYELFLKQVIPHIQEIYLRFIAPLKFKYSSIDTAIYIKARLWRLPMSVHVKTGLWRIHLSLDELNSLTLGEIRNMAAEPRSLAHDIDYTLNNEMWYALVHAKKICNANKSVAIKVDESREKHRQWKIAATKKQFVLPDDPAKILEILGHNPKYAKIVDGVPEKYETADFRGRNGGLCMLVGACKKLGCSKVLTEDVALLFNDRCSPPKNREDILKVVRFYV